MKGSEFGSLKKNETLAAYIELHSRKSPDKTAYQLVGKDCIHSDAITYRELDELSRAAAYRVAAQSKQSDRVILLFPQCLEFIISFACCMKAGLISVPVSVPSRSRGIEILDRIISDSDAKLILSTAATRLRVEELFPDSKAAKQCTWIDIHLTDLRDELSTSTIAGLSKNFLLPDNYPEIAMLQYTSGSTGSPKGVKVTHKNLLLNQAMMQVGFALTSMSKIGTWLPLYHDMGLIGTILQTMYSGASCFVMPPAQFIKRPYDWLKMISDNGIEIAGCPNFGYQACVDRISDGEIASLNLSEWKLAFSGAEPIRAETLEAFSERFSPAGFNKRAFTPCYGLAETTLYVCSKTQEQTYKQISACAKSLENGVIKIAPNSESTSRAEADLINERQLVSCGAWPADTDIWIVDPGTGSRLDESHVGEIWVCGDHVTHGYWNKDAQTESAFPVIQDDIREKRFHRTGDLGFIHNAELYITGRLKDVLIINGKNHYPSDIESLVEQQMEEICPSGVAAIQVHSSGKDQVVIFSETKIFPKNDNDRVALSRKISALVTHKIGVPIADVVLIRKNSLPKTTSGKVQRSKIKQIYLSNNSSLPFGI